MKAVDLPSNLLDLSLRTAETRVGGGQGKGKLKGAAAFPQIFVKVNFVPIDNDTDTFDNTS